jgi:hypothetical protein
MKRFDFPLERVRRWRREQASLEELKLQQLRAEMAGLQAAQRQIETDRAQSEQQVLTQAYVDPLLLVSLDSYRQHTAGQVRQLESRGQQCEAKIQEQLNRVIEARRKFELLERLRQAALDEWQAAVDKEQEDLAAELFLAKSSRRKN